MYEDEIRQLIKENEWIKHDTQLENAQLLALFKESQIGFLPTSKDTFGYSVLEMQASAVLSSQRTSKPHLKSMIIVVVGSSACHKQGSDMR